MLLVMQHDSTVRLWYGCLDPRRQKPQGDGLLSPTFADSTSYIAPMSCRSTAEQGLRIVLYFLPSQKPSDQHLALCTSCSFQKNAVVDYHYKSSLEGPLRDRANIGRYLYM